MVTSTVIITVTVVPLISLFHPVFPTYKLESPLFRSLRYGYPFGFYLLLFPSRIRCHLSTRVIPISPGYFLSHLQKSQEENDRLKEG